MFYGPNLITFVVTIDRHNLLEKSSHVTEKLGILLHNKKIHTFVRMLFLQNEEIQNQPRVVKKHGSIDIF